MLRREWARVVAAGSLAIGLGAGCGSRAHSEFTELTTPGTAVTARAGTTSRTLAKDEAITVTVAAYDDKGLAVPGVKFDWKSFNTAVATVAATADGASTAVITGVAAGTTTISATSRAVQQGSTTVGGGLIASMGVSVTTSGAVKLSFAGDGIQAKAGACDACHASMATGSMASLSNLLSKGYVVSENPAGSPFLQKGSGLNGHGGGDKWVTDQTKQLVSEWIQQGANP